MMKRTALFSVTFLFLLSMCGCVRVSAPEPCGPLPSADQLRWQDMEIATCFQLPSIGCSYGYGTPEELDNATLRISGIHELPEAVEAGTRKKITHTLRSLGFAYVALDLDGYRQGSMNETLSENR